MLTDCILELCMVSTSFCCDLTKKKFCIVYGIHQVEIALEFNFFFCQSLVSFRYLFLIGGVFGKIIAQLSTAAQTNYANAGQMADEALTAIRVVMSFGTYEREVKKFVFLLQGLGARF